jgi:hypothetical protein
MTDSVADWRAPFDSRRYYFPERRKGESSIHTTDGYGSPRNEGGRNERGGCRLIWLIRRGEANKNVQRINIYNKCGLKVGDLCGLKSGYSPSVYSIHRIPPFHLQFHRTIFHHNSPPSSPFIHRHFPLFHHNKIRLGIIIIFICPFLRIQLAHLPPFHSKIQFQFKSNFPLPFSLVLLSILGKWWSSASSKVLFSFSQPN